jgi:hypothetical protein
VVTPMARRRVVGFVQDGFGASQRRACHALGVARSTVRYVSRRDDDPIREPQKPPSFGAIRVEQCARDGAVAEGIDEATASRSAHRLSRSLPRPPEPGPRCRDVILLGRFAIRPAIGWVADRRPDACKRPHLIIAR